MGLPTPQEDVTVTTFSQSSRDMHVTVEKPAAGCLCTLSMLAKVPLGPDELYELLVDPVQCMRVFKSLKRVDHRRVLSDDGAGNREVEVDQTGAWRFLCFRGAFTVRMIVEQRRAERTIRFRLARPGFMKQFTGTWQIRPFDNASLDQLVNQHNPTPLHRLQASPVVHQRGISGLSSLRAVEASLGLGASHEESLVQLQQSIAPAFVPPKPVARALQRIAASQISKIMGDLQAEVQRINSASSSSSSSSEASGKAISGSTAQDGAASATAEGKQQAQAKGRWRQAAATEEEEDGHPQPAEPQRLDWRQLASHVRSLR
ncbi:hypothetical protein ABPG77_001452 [Micractinium sp. CCAP 211/92]